MKNHQEDEIDWSKVPGVGTSKSKTDWSEFFKGIWMLYLYLCFALFFFLILGIFEEGSIYIEHIGFFILFFIPSVAYLIYKTTESFKYKKVANDYDNLIPKYEFIKHEFLNREEEWKRIEGEILGIGLLDMENKKKMQQGLNKIWAEMNKIGDDREKRIAFSDEKRDYPTDYFLDLRKLLGMKYGDNKYDEKIED